MPGGLCGPRSARAACARTPPSLASLSDGTYLVLGLVGFLAAAAVQYGLYASMLQRALRLADLELARPAIARWVKTVLVFQTLVLLATGSYVAVMASRHLHGIAWTAPAIGAVIGTALPLQLAVMSILRAGRR